MAQIVINEISQNYAFNAANSSFCTVALPITACWGPAYEDPATLGITKDEELENTAWNLFPSNQEGLEKFVATYRGPASNYRAAKDFSYQTAMTLLSSGYDVLVCRVCPGTHAQATVTDSVSEGTLTLIAKYPGTFGNNIIVNLKKVVNRKYWNAIVYVVDSNNVKTAVENLVFAFDLNDSSDAILHISEIESNFVKFAVSGSISDNADFGTDTIYLGSDPLHSGTDKAADTTAPEMLTNAIALATARYQEAGTDATQYLEALNAVFAAGTDVATASRIKYNEWIYNAAYDVFDILKDKLAYNPKRLICEWDDQNITAIDGSTPARLNAISPLHIKLMDVAYYGRCAAALISVPQCLPRSAVYNDTADSATEGYVQKLSTYLNGGPDGLYTSHAALFAPWGQYTYVGTSRQNLASPAFLALLIQRGMLMNQALQYEWLVPSTRTHNVPIGKLQYNVPKKLLDEWNSDEGANLNVIADIPDLGIGIWGDRTLYNVPPATWNALENLSSRYVVNAVKDVVYRVGLSITFQLNNAEAYSRFYAGCTPLLDTMVNAGAIKDYKVRMAADINGLDQVNARTVIGKVYLVFEGIIENIIVDLVCLPPSVDLEQY